MGGVNYDLQAVPLDVVRSVVERYHGYGSIGDAATYAFAVYESANPVAVYAWQPPPPGVAKAVCPDAPQGVLALSRMAAVPREMRKLNHVSRPLRRQMNRIIDRTRWPVLVTFSDLGQGHTGHVYKCSGWTPTTANSRPFYIDADGRRRSSYSNGRHGSRTLTFGGTTTLQRWEHWACARGDAWTWMQQHGWVKVPIQGKVWRSGNQSYTYRNTHHA